jgi:hypothetical protein
MGNYIADVYPHRNDLHRFVNLLLRASPSQYTENLELGYLGRRPGSRSRIPQELDKVRVRALLDAWNRHISDRYLDFPRVQTLDRAFDPRLGRGVAVRQAQHLIDQNASHGAVKFIYNELSRDRDVTEARMSDRGSYNWMYSALSRLVRPALLFPRERDRQLSPTHRRRGRRQFRSAHHLSGRLATHHRHVPPSPHRLLPVLQRP